MTITHSTQQGHRFLALLVGLALVVAACSDDSAGPVAEQPENDIASDTTTLEDEGEPVHGGRLVYGLEANAANPWTPQSVVCDVSCHMVMRTVFDTLAVYVDDEDGNPTVAPYLLESFEPNADFTEWTLTPRQGITFHDGTPFDAAAIKANLEGHRASFVNGRALADIESIEVLDGNAVVTTDRPWAHFPDQLTGSIGYMASPSWLAAVADGTAPSDEPVGTGPFVFQSYESGGSFVAVRNNSYWQEGLPYLDEIELRVVTDQDSRRTALVNGDLTMTLTGSGDSIAFLRERDGLETTEVAEYGEVNYVLLNVADPESPVSDIRVRRALAHAIDRDAVVERRRGGVGNAVDGPFGAGQLGELEDTGYPEFDQERAREQLDEYRADMGIEGSVPISFTTTADPFNRGTAELFKQFWDAVGFDTQLAQIEQSQFILTALRGDFEAFGWRGHGGPNPDVQRVWWHSETAACGVRDTCPEGVEPALGLNFGRIRDDEIDAALDRIRETDDPEILRDEAENINRRFGEMVYSLWTNEIVWMWAKHPSVNGLGGWTTPEGDRVLDLNGPPGAHGLINLWCNDGACGS